MIASQNESGGFVKLYRSLLDHDIAFDDELLGLFIRILLLCNFRERKFEGETIKPGEFVITSRKAPSRLYGDEHPKPPSINTIRKRFGRLEEMELIRTSPFVGGRGGTLIQVINWEKYQASVTVAKSATPTTRNNGSVSKSDTERDTQADTERDTERIMYKNGKNEKNPDLTSLPFPSKKFQECWRDWETHRKEIKKPLTPTAIKQQHKQMAEWGEAWSIRVMRHTMAQGWQGLREPDGEKRPTNNASRVATAEDLANWRPEAIYD